MHHNNNNTNDNDDDDDDDDDDLGEGGLLLMLPLLLLLFEQEGVILFGFSTVYHVKRAVKLHKYEQHFKVVSITNIVEFELKKAMSFLSCFFKSTLHYTTLLQ
jgi:hypothetical protein